MNKDDTLKRLETETIDFRTKPTAEQCRRAKIADRLFGFHHEMNKLLGGIAMQIIDGADVTAALTILKHNHMPIFNQAMKDCERIQKEEGL